MTRLLPIVVLISSLGAAEAEVRLSRAEYQDRALASWYGQIIGTLMGFQFEHKQGAVKKIDQLPAIYQSAPVDDDYFYEMVALRAFEKYGIGMSVEQLGAQWKENNAGAWGSSEQTRLLLAKGVPAEQAGHPRYNKLWFSIGPQFSADVYGMLAPGMPNMAGRLARKYGHINGYAEGVDGAVFVAGMVSLGFREKDPRKIVREAAQLIDTRSPYRQAIDEVILRAERGEKPLEIAEALNRKWQIEYPATNNAVANGAMIALSVWFGEGDYLQTVNLAFMAGDFTDADCNAANAGAVVGAMRGMKGIPAHLVAQLHDRIEGKEMGGVPVRPDVSETISALGVRTAKLGLEFVAAQGGKVDSKELRVAAESVKTQPAELFALGDFAQLWNPDWTLVHAGFGGAGGGLKGLRGNTFLDGDVLATYPRDEVRANYLTRTVRVKTGEKLELEVGVDKGRVWQLDVFADNDRLVSKLIEGGPEVGKQWQTVTVPLDKYAGQEIVLRLYQRVLVSERVAGNAYWRKAQIR